MSVSLALLTAWTALFLLALLVRIIRFCWIVYGRPLPEVDIAPPGVDGYWGVVCGRFLPAKDGLIVHDNIPHPPMMAFDDEVHPQ